MQSAIARSPSILIAEYNELTARDTTRALRALGYDPRIACDAITAMVALDDQVDLLFTAIALPKIDGFMLADMVKSHRPRMSVIYTTDDLPVASKRMETAGRVHGPILKRPYNQDDLENAIAEAFALSDAQTPYGRHAGNQGILL